MISIKKTLHVPFGMIYTYLECGYPWNGFGIITDGNDTVMSSFKYGDFICSVESQDRLEVSIQYSGNDSSICVPSHVTHANGVVYKVSRINDYAFLEKKKIKRVTLPLTVRTISSQAFQDCENMKEIILPDSLTHIDDYSFRGCTNLHLEYLPQTLQYLGEGAFVGCSSIYSIEIPKEVSHIGKYAFLSTHEITAHWEKPEGKLLENILSGSATPGILYVPTGTLIEYNQQKSDISSFYGIGLISDQNGNFVERSFVCDNCLYKVNEDFCVDLLKSMSNGQKDVTIPDSVKSDLTGITYRVESIHHVAFAGNDCVTLHISDGIQRIGNDSFNYCTKLERVFLPESVLKIGTFAFQNCNHLKHIFCKSTIPPIIQHGTFPSEKITIHVPRGSIVSYKNTPPWSNKRYKYVDIEPVQGKH